MHANFHNMGLLGGSWFWVNCLAQGQIPENKYFQVYLQNFPDRTILPLGLPKGWRQWWALGIREHLPALVHTLRRTARIGLKSSVYPTWAEVCSGTPLGCWTRRRCPHGDGLSRPRWTLVINIQRTTSKPPLGCLFVYLFPIRFLCPHICNSWFSPGPRVKEKKGQKGKIRRERRRDGKEGRRMEEMRSKESGESLKEIKKKNVLYWCRRLI